MNGAKNMTKATTPYDIIQTAVPSPIDVASAMLDDAIADATEDAIDRNRILAGISALMEWVYCQIQANGKACVTLQRACEATRIEGDPNGYEMTLFYSLRRRGNALLTLIGACMREKGYKAELADRNDSLTVSVL